ncbi:hypothetical protein [Flavobacterium sp. '19STA2R22 D10 B1']|uniref:hypothetical protein n=1 Tax=Flavobacterium aerium TaxID=3037261 RepID=UPI00278BD296|nr:hypothetical protein [Flavobacterium sp. '19STA2R22 D10 B1']
MINPEIIPHLEEELNNIEQKYLALNGYRFLKKSLTYNPNQQKAIGIALEAPISTDEVAPFSYLILFDAVDQWYKGAILIAPKPYLFNKKGNDYATLMKLNSAEADYYETYIAEAFTDEASYHLAKEIPVEEPEEIIEEYVEEYNDEDDFESYLTPTLQFTKEHALEILSLTNLPCYDQSYFHELHQVIAKSDLSIEWTNSIEEWLNHNAEINDWKADAPTINWMLNAQLENLGLSSFNFTALDLEMVGNHIADCSLSLGAIYTERLGYTPLSFQNGNDDIAFILVKKEHVKSLVLLASEINYLDLAPSQWHQKSYDAFAGLSYKYSFFNTENWFKEENQVTHDKLFKLWIIEKQKEGFSWANNLLGDAYYFGKHGFDENEEEATKYLKLFTVQLKTLLTQTKANNLLYYYHYLLSNTYRLLDESDLFLKEIQYGLHHIPAEDDVVYHLYLECYSYGVFFIPSSDKNWMNTATTYLKYIEDRQDWIKSVVSEDLQESIFEYYEKIKTKKEETPEPVKKEVPFWKRLFGKR